MKHGKMSSTCATLMILVILASSGIMLAQSSANYSIKKSAVDAGGGSAGSAGYQVNDAIGQPGGIGAAAGAGYQENGGFFADAVVVTGIEEKTLSGKPDRFELFQNYPNPFNPSTTVRYSVPESGPVKLTVYDINGREVAILLDESKEPGRYALTYDIRGLGSGIYFYRLQAVGFTATRKFTVLK